MHTLDSSHISAIKVLERRAVPRGATLRCSNDSFLALFDTTSRAVGGKLDCDWHRTLGISPLRGSLRAAPIYIRDGGTIIGEQGHGEHNLPKLLLDGWVPLSTLVGRLLCRYLHRWSWRILRIAFPYCGLVR